MTPQEQALLDYLKQGNTITPLESISILGILALSQRAGSLRRAGHPIVAERITTPTGKHVARYRLA
jgi:hypothetical protein